MSKYYRMTYQTPHDGALIYQKNYTRVLLQTGKSLVGKLDTQGPLICTLDEELRLGPLPSFFESPALIATNTFYDILKKCGVVNLESFPVKIIDPVSNESNFNYSLINIIGSARCTNLKMSTQSKIAHDIVLVDNVVLERHSIPNLDMFLTEEDTRNIIISERLYLQLSKEVNKEVRFDELRVI